MLVYIEQDILQIVQPISEETFLPPSVVFDLQRICKGDPLSYDMRPSACNSQKRDEFFNAVLMYEVGFFYVKSSTFKICKKDFNAPAFFIGIQCGLTLLVLVAGKNEVLVLQSQCRHIHRQVINAAGSL